MARSFPSAKFKWLDPVNFSRNKYDDGSLRPCVLEANLEYPKELHELLNDYSLALDKLEIKKICLIINEKLLQMIVFLLAILKNLFSLSFTKKSARLVTKTCDFILDWD